MIVNEGLRSTVREIRRHSENILEAERRIQGGTPPVISEKPDPRTKRNIRLEGIPRRVQSALDRKAQVILYGPPALERLSGLNALRTIWRLFRRLVDDLTIWMNSRSMSSLATANHRASFGCAASILHTDTRTF